mgnify:CR=1 FL=1
MHGQLHDGVTHRPRPCSCPRPTPYPCPCRSRYRAARRYLNKAEVQAAIHVAGPGSVQWGVCSDAINEGYNQDDVAAPMMPIWKELVKHPELNLLVYSGDDDSICATSGAQLWIWGMGAPHDKWRPWHSGGQVLPGFCLLAVSWS